LSIPTNPSQKLRDAIESRVKHPRFNDVVECIEIQDGLIFVGEITDEKRTSLAWVLEMLETESDEDLMTRSKSIKTAVGVFDGIVANLQKEDQAAMHEEQVALAKRHVNELSDWMVSWSTWLEGFMVIMSGINPETLKQLGFAGFKLTDADGDKPQWAKLSLAELIERVQAEESILGNFAFRRALMSGMSRFYVYAFNQLGRDKDEIDMLDAADELSVASFGDRARLADRTNIRGYEPPAAKTTAKKKPESKQKAQQRGADEYKTRMDHKDRNRGYVQEGGRPKKG
jgi:hypothetical protein